jgi:D-alanine-D-alanine ligase
MQNNNATNTRREVLVVREHNGVWAEDAIAEVLAVAEAIHVGLSQSGYDVIPIQVQAPDALPALLQPFRPGRHIVFNWYEGVEAAGEDGAQVAALLEDLGFVFTGSGTLALRTAQNKIHGKRVLATHNIPTPQWQSLARDDLNGWKCFPAIVKVADEHGSECLTEQSLVYDAISLQTRVDELRSAGYQSLMVSEFIEGREIMVALWGNGALECLPLLEVDYSACPSSFPHLRTCSSKWDTSSEAYQKIKIVSPHDLPPALSERIKGIARQTFRAFGLRDYARIDLRVQNDVPYVIDVNCNPDIANDASFPLAASLAGYDYAAMLDHLVQLALHRVGGDWS